MTAPQFPPPEPISNDAPDAGKQREDVSSIHTRISRSALTIITLVMAILFLIPGLIGHAPWKQDETYTMGLILHILHTHDWVVPTLTGQPFMEKPPLYYIVAAQFVRIFSPWLSVADAARLTSGFFMAITLSSLWIAAHAWGYGRRAPVVLLAFIGCLGLVMPAHTLFTDVALLTGFTIAYTGFAWALRRPSLAGIVMGTGVGIGFMAKGLLAPGIVGVSALLLPLLFRQWRTRTYLQTLTIALLFALPWLIIWPVALYHRSFTLFMQWFWQNNIGRYLGFSVARLGAGNDPQFWWKTLPWFTFPALPMAIYGLWQQPRSMEREPMIQFGAVSTVVVVTVLALAASARTNYALPLLPPIALLAATYKRTPSERWRHIHWWSAVVLFGGVGIYLWTVWGVMHVSGHPPTWVPLHKKLPMNFKPHFHAGFFVAAVALSVLWVALVSRYRRNPQPLLAWVGGVILVWGLLATIMLPWINMAKSYRTAFTPMSQYIPANHGCIANVALGESERAMLQYYDHIITLPMSSPMAKTCHYLVVEKHRHEAHEPSISAHWHLLWTGHRDGDDHELFWLYRRTHS